MIRTLLLAGLAAGAYVLIRDGRARRAFYSPTAQPPSLQRWESEGGGVPVGGGHTAAYEVHHDDGLTPFGEPTPRGMP